MFAPHIPLCRTAICTVAIVAATRAAEPAPSPLSGGAPAISAPALTRWTDANGNFNRLAPTGHVTNYDETKVGTYTLPDPLVMSDGIAVRSADDWVKRRRPEILDLYEKEIYGRVPGNAPKATFEVGPSDDGGMPGRVTHKIVTINFGDRPGGPVVHLKIYLPAGAKAPVPLLLHLVFGDGPRPGAAAETGPIAEFVNRGYGYAVFRYTEVEPDGGGSGRPSVRALAGRQSGLPPAGDAWGTISAWAWCASRVLDYLATDSAVDSTRVALVGHSRLGKTVLWASAQDQRFALVFSSCAGEMGSSLARRDYGETVDDMASNGGHQFAVNFQKYLGHVQNLPVDTHLLIALSAPRPVLITGGTQDQWADPRGEFLGEVAAGPVYRLLGKRDLGTERFPAVDTPLADGDLAFHYHTGPHAITVADWTVFLNFADRYLHPTPPSSQ